VPTRPSQNNPDRVASWEHTRRLVGANIVALRSRRGLTQEALALRSGISRNVLIDVEHGRRGLLYERLFDLAEALDVPVTALLGHPHPPPGGPMMACGRTAGHRWACHTDW
jgi:DNA-binding XRE family transcriptional regulator